MAAGCRVRRGTANIPNNGRAAAGWAQLGDEKCSWSNQLQLGRQLKRKSGVLRVFAVINCRCAAAAKWSTALQCCSAAVTPAFSHVVTGDQYSIMLMLKCIFMSLKNFFPALCAVEIILKHFVALSKKARSTVMLLLLLLTGIPAHTMNEKCSAGFQFRSQLPASLSSGSGCGWWWVLMTDGCR